MVFESGVSQMGLPCLVMFVGVLCITFSKRLARDSVKQRIWTKFVLPRWPSFLHGESSKKTCIVGCSAALVCS